MSSLRCFCSEFQKETYIEDIKNFGILCSKNCNFCKFKKKHKTRDIYKLIRGLAYNDIKLIIGFDEILCDQFVFEDVINTKCDNICFDDLNIMLDQKTLTNITTSVVKKICSVVEKILIKQKSIYGSEKENLAIIMLRKMMTNESLLANQYINIIGFVLKILSKGLITKISDLGVHIADFSMLLELYLDKPIDCESDFSPLIQIINEGTFFRIGREKFEKINLLPSYVFDILFNKLENIIDYISYCGTRYVEDVVTISVNPVDITTSLKLTDESIETEIFLDKLSCINKTFVEYLVTDTKSMGYDAGGLTKDFYSLISSEIFKNCEDVDGFMFPKRDSGIHPNVWKFYGIMICRSIFIEKLSVSINIHPVLCYFFCNNIKNIKIKHFFDILSLFDIDYICNVKKVLEMSESEYLEFMELQCEEHVSKTSYIGNQIYQKYIFPEVLYIIDGFRMSLSRHIYTNYVSTVCLYRNINGDWKYDINGNSTHSLKKNLEVNLHALDSETLKNKSHLNTEMKKKYYYKETFINVLNYYNENDRPLLKKFIKFWLGTSSISTFNDMNCSIDIIKKNTYGCFESHTCFNKLDVDANYVNLSSDLGESIKNMIDKSLRNQDLCEAAGYRMQFM